MADTRLAPRFEDYNQKYTHIRLARTDGILEVRMHSAGDSLNWTPRVHEELGYCFNDIARDPDNKVVIITGEGSTFCTDMDRNAFIGGAPSWKAVHQEGRDLIENLLSIAVPVIGVVNGPAHIHAEILLLSDIVLAADHATIQDPIHFTAGWVPGDGVHVFWPALIGRTRASYFLLMGETLDAVRARELGLVNEVHSAEAVHSRAVAIAEQLATQPPLVRRYARTLMTQEIRRQMHDNLSHGLALEGLAYLDQG